MGCTLEDLDDTTCRFPIGEPGEADFHFCGAAPAGDSPYCRHHTRLAYRSRRRAPRPPLNGYTCAPCPDGWLLLLPSPWRDRRRRPGVDAGVSNAAEIRARHRQALARLAAGAPADAALATVPAARPADESAVERMPSVVAPALAPLHLASLQEAVPLHRPPRRFRAIMQAVAAFYAVAVCDLASSRRTSGLVQSRHVAWYLCRHLTAASFAEIGRHFGGRNHAAVLHGVRGIARRLRADAKLAGEIAVIEAELRATEADIASAHQHVSACDRRHPDNAA